MSILFGIRKSAGGHVRQEELVHLASATNRYALDGTSIALHEAIGMGFQPYHTHERSTLESLPLLDDRKDMVAFDGRIDNHAELAELLDITDRNSPDSLIVLAAFRRWGQESFSRLIGDWAVAIWNDIEHTLYLARDHAGARTLYFEQRDDTVVWSTYLDTFFASPANRELDERYAACYLASQPLRDLTPYKGIRAVLPAHYVKLRDGVVSSARHWNWIVTGTIRYRNESEYDEHFRSLFRQSVRRRTGPGAPILAQLSGGMDSSSIVCVSDEEQRSRGASSKDLLDTISFYDDSEPDWNEKPYFSIVEGKRGKGGFHLDRAHIEETLDRPDSTLGSNLLPGTDSSTIMRERAVEELIRGYGFRVVLSGIGGDEVLGGVPTALPELADLLVTGNLSSLVARSIAWCLPSRTPLIQALGNTAGHLLQLYFRIQGNERQLPPWIGRGLQRQCEEAGHSDVARSQRLGHMPSRIDNGLAWWSIMESLPHANPNALSRLEYRYPYLDRDLVEFLFRIPREQIVQPGRRRLLMRRALKGIVPEEILERRRKAFVSRSAVTLLAQRCRRVEAIVANSPFVAAGHLDRDAIGRALKSAIETGEVRWAQALLRTTFFLLWLDSINTSPETAESFGVFAVH